MIIRIASKIHPQYLHIALTTEASIVYYQVYGVNLTYFGFFIRSAIVKRKQITKLQFHIRNQEKLFMLNPVPMPYGSCTDNCSYTAENSCCLSFLYKLY
jgi:hypothetical protein